VKRGPDGTAILDQHEVELIFHALFDSMKFRMEEVIAEVRGPKMNRILMYRRDEMRRLYDELEPIVLDNAAEAQRLRDWVMQEEGR
jgi:hypothetical protein